MNNEMTDCTKTVFEISQELGIIETFETPLIRKLRKKCGSKKGIISAIIFLLFGGSTFFVSFHYLFVPLLVVGGLMLANEICLLNNANKKTTPLGHKSHQIAAFTNLLPIATFGVYLYFNSFFKKAIYFLKGEYADETINVYIERINLNNENFFALCVVFVFLIVAVSTVLNFCGYFSVSKMINCNKRCKKAPVLAGVFGIFASLVVVSLGVFAVIICYNNQTEVLETIKKTSPFILFSAYCFVKSLIFF